MLGTPPAFILSQDQTLRLILVCRFPVRGNRRVLKNNSIQIKDDFYKKQTRMCFLSSGMYVSVLYLLDNPKTYLSLLSNCHSIRFSRCSERAFRMMCIRGYLPQSSLLILPTPTTHCKHFFWKCENWVGARKWGLHPKCRKPPIPAAFDKT